MGSVSDPDLEGVDVKSWNGAHNGGITEGSTPTCASKEVQVDTAGSKCRRELVCVIQAEQGILNSDMNAHVVQIEGLP